jgi:fructokinase
MLKTVAIGEILWDIFGDIKHLGGAPFNFSYFAGVLGAESTILSGISNDELGKEILSILKKKGINSRHIQIDPFHPTGKVLVDTSEPGCPKYNILKDVAYDYLELREKDIELVRESDILCFGTLAQRNGKSRETIQSLLTEAQKALIIYDINIRQNFYSEEVIEKSLYLSDVLKLNKEEMDFLRGSLGFDKSASIKDVSLQLLDKYDLQLICITNGREGCQMFSEKEDISSQGYKVKVEDTVGSGDAFTAGFATRYVETGNIKESADFANLIGGYVASKSGATPEIDWEEIKNIGRVTKKMPEGRRKS